MSRAQWCCLVAALAVVLGLLGAPAVTGAVPVSGPVVAAAADTGIPGCDRNRDHEGSDPVLPARTRAAHDLAPGPVAAVLPAAGRDRPPAVRLAVRGPRPATPTPVELSVLRV
ncbi:hypothetical protein ACFWVP_12345 [Streptomyces sp. NPDC058637]|uniref:hypothetical protein n=1 Tax=Streptomyces sp. NPDC058637 TaxID=3346569 RepID=UPI0036678ED1